MRFLHEQEKFFNTETLSLVRSSKWERVASRPGEGVEFVMAEILTK